MRCTSDPWPLVLVIALSVLSFQSVASAQVAFVGTEPSARRVWTAGGWDPVWVTSFGYAAALGAPSAYRPITGDLALTVPVFVQPDVRAWKLTTGASTLFRLPAPGLAVAVSLRATAAIAHDPTGTKLGIGYELVAQPGFYGRLWTLALDLAWRAVPVAHFWHSAVVRDLFHDRHDLPASDAQGPPEDGWYRFAANRVRIGGAAGRRLGSRAAASVAAAYEHTFQAQGIIANPSFGQLPFYVLAGGDYRW